MSCIKDRKMSRFATVDEVRSTEFMSLSRILDQLTTRYNFPDHSDVNQERYPWATGLLSSPAFYAARMWEYPYAILSAELKPGIRCADIGCGMTPFTVFLKEIAKCEVVGIDSHIFDVGISYKGHGVSREFVRKTGLQIVQCGGEAIPFSSNTFDRVFCLSVVEHLSPDVARRGFREMARILKPGGRAIITADVNMFSEISRPLDLIWDSGLLPLGDMDLRWPTRRFGIFCDGKQPADVFGMTLIKEDYPVETQYTGVGGSTNPSLISASLIPTMRRQSTDGESARLRKTNRQIWRQGLCRVQKALGTIFQG